MQRFKKILLVLDGSNDQTVLCRAVDLATSNGATLKVVSVLEDVARDLHFLCELNPLIVPQEKRIAQIRVGLEKLVEPFADKVKISTKVLVGKPHLAVIREVLCDWHDLVMCMFHPVESFGENLTGNTHMRLMRKCPCPIWAIKPDAPERYGKIIAALARPEDTQDYMNHKIMELATSLSRREGSQLHVVHSCDYYSESLKPPQVGSDEWNDATFQLHKRWLENFLLDYPVTTPCVHLVRGEAGLIIPRLVDKLGVDLIVMGTACRSGLHGFLIGNTAERVLQRVDCSILTHKPDGFQTPVR